MEAHPYSGKLLKTYFVFQHKNALISNQIALFLSLRTKYIPVVTNKINKYSPSKHFDEMCAADCGTLCFTVCVDALLVKKTDVRV